MPTIKDLINSLRAMELPKGAESLLSSIGTEADTLEADRNDLRGKVATRQDENATLKQRAQTAEAERDDLKTKVPGADAVVLNKADAERWRVLKSRADELGGVDKLEAQLGRVSELEAEKVKGERHTAMRKANYDPAKLERLIGSLPFEVEGEGDQQKVTVTVGEEKKPLAEYAEAEGFVDLLNVAVLEPGNPIVVLPQAGPRQPSTKDAGAEHRKSRHGYKKKG